MKLPQFMLTVFAVAVFALPAVPCSAILFTFSDDSNANAADPFDGGNGSGAGEPGNSMTGTDVTGTLILTLVDVIGQDGTSAGSGPNTDHLSNIAGNLDALGVNTDNTADDAPGLVSGSSDSSHFNLGERVVFSFDQAVTLTDVELESFTPGDHTFQVITSGGATDLGESNNSLSISLAANETFQLAFVGLTGSDNLIRVESLSASIVAIPEPTAFFALLGVTGLVITKRRSRAV